MARDELLTSIRKGAEYIEKIGTAHPNYKVALTKYERLVQELYALDGRDANGLSPMAEHDQTHERQSA